MNTSYELTEGTRLTDSLERELAAGTLFEQSRPHPLRAIGRWILRFADLVASLRAKSPAEQHEMI